jgi:hypothetical protein
VRHFGVPPTSPARRERWIREVSAVAAYRDRWHITGQSVFGKREDLRGAEQTGQRQRAQAAAARAMAISGAGAEQQNISTPQVAVEVQRGVDL